MTLEKEPRKCLFFKCYSGWYVNRGGLVEYDDNACNFVGKILFL